MSSLVAAVGGDTFGGLSGFKRPTSSNPTRVPNNLPAFRGVKNNPGSNIRAGPIKSSANHPDRKTNVCIPYARQTPLRVDANIGRVSAGDIVFVSRDRPGLPGYAHSRFTRLAGVDALNRWLSVENWSMRAEDGRYKYIAVDPLKIADDWRAVPFLGEWSLDGVVLSNEEREVYYNDSVGKHDGQLYNIAIQGPCAVNNGYADEQGRGQVTQNMRLFAPGYMNHRVERMGKETIEYDHRLTIQSDYKGDKYHLFPLQMFDREIRPMNELFCGLVATEYTFDASKADLLKNYANAKSELDKTWEKLREYDQLRQKWIADKKAAEDEGKDVSGWGDYDDTLPDGEKYEKLDEAYTSQRTELENLMKNRVEDVIKNAKRAYQAWLQLGFWNDADQTVKEGAPSSVFGFKWVLFTSAQAWELDSDIDVAAPNGYGGPSGNGARMKRQKLERDPWDQPEQRKDDMRRMVGAWRVGRVLDMKSAKMPWFEGGPMDTGFRCTTDVNVEWWDWRRLRHAFTSNPDAPQFADLLPGTGLRFGDIAFQDGFDDSKRVTRWPTRYDIIDDKKNVPVNPFPFYAGKDIPDGDAEAYQKSGFDEGKLGITDLPEQLEIDNDRAADNVPEPRQPRGDAPRLLPDGDDDFVARNTPKTEKDNPNEDSRVTNEIDAKLHELRQPKLVLIPGHGSRPSARSHITRATASITNLKILLAPPSEEEIPHLNEIRARRRALVKTRADVASYVMAPKATTAAASSSTAAAETEAVSVAEIVAPSVVMLSAPTATGPMPGATEAAQSSGASPAEDAVMEEETTAADASTAASAASAVEAPPPPAKTAPRKRSTAPQADVFSSIFGGSDTASSMQPLNPAHRADGGSGGAGSTGRSFARRGKGKEKDSSGS